MRNPFSLLIKGLILASIWWASLTLLAHPAGFLVQTWPRLIFWLSGIFAAGLAAFLFLLNKRDGLRQLLAPSHYWGVDVTLGQFPVTEVLPIPSANKIQALLKLAKVEAPITTCFQGLDPKIVNIINAMLAYIAGHRQSNQLLSEAWQCYTEMQSLATTFNYRGLTAREIPPADDSFRLKAQDPLIPVIAFAHPLGMIMSEGVAIDSPQCTKLSVRLLTRIPEIRSLEFDEQHVLYQVLAHYVTPEKLPVTRAKEKVSLRSDRIVALIELVRAAKQLDVTYLTHHHSAVGPSSVEPPSPVNLEKSETQEQPAPQVVELVIPESDSVVCEASCYNVLYDLLHEPFRVNGSKADLRVGLLHGEYVYLITDKVIEGMKRKDGGDSNAIVIKQKIIDALDAKEMLYKSGDRKHFCVQFKGLIKKEEKTNNYTGMIIFSWAKHMPLLGNLGDSLFVPTICESGVFPEAQVKNSQPAEGTDAPTGQKPSASSSALELEALNFEDLASVADGPTATVKDSFELAIKEAIEPTNKELAHIRRTIYEELNRLLAHNHPFIASLQEADDHLLCISFARVETQEVPVSINQIALLLKHKEQVTGFQVRKNDKGSTILCFAQA